MITRKICRLPAVMLVGLCCMGVSPVWALDVAAGINLGTTGAGVSATFNVNDYFNARLGYNNLRADAELEEDGVDYEVNIDMKTTELLLDWYPWSGSFRTTIGFIANGSDFEGVGSISEATDIGGVTVLEGSASSELDFDNSAYYFGIGWGDPVGDNDGLSIVSDIGVIMLGEPDFNITDVTVVSSVGNVPVTQAEIDREEQNVQDELEDYLWPVLRVSLVYRF